MKQRWSIRRMKHATVVVGAILLIAGSQAIDQEEEVGFFDRILEWLGSSSETTRESDREGATPSEVSGRAGCVRLPAPSGTAG